MTDIRAIDRVRGSLFSVQALSALSDEPCSVLFVSPRTEHILSEIALNEVDFRVRYSSSVEIAGKYHPVDPDDVAEMDLIQDVARNFKLEVKDMTSEIVMALDGIKAAILTSTSNACACGTVGETLETTAGVPGSEPPEGFGEPDPTVTDRLCKAANSIHESIADTIIELDNSPVEGFLTLGFGLVAGIVSATIAAAFIPVVGILMVGVAGAVVGVTTALLAGSVDLGQLRTSLAAKEVDLVCALTSAVSAGQARSNYLAVLATDGNGTTNQALISAFMANDVLNILWFSTEDSEAFLKTYVPPVSCITCPATFLHEFDFTIDEQGWLNGAAFGRDFGTYVPGVGWEGEWGTVALKEDERLYLQRTFASRTITTMTVWYTMTGPDGVESNTAIDTIVTDETQAPWPCTNCSFVQTYSPDPADVTTELRAIAVADAPAEFGTDILCYKIVVGGLGADPF